MLRKTQIIHVETKLSKLKTGTILTKDPNTTPTGDSKDTVGPRKVALTKKVITYASPTP